MPLTIDLSPITPILVRSLAEALEPREQRRQRQRREAVLNLAKLRPTLEELPSPARIEVAQAATSPPPLPLLRRLPILKEIWKEKEEPLFEPAELVAMLPPKREERMLSEKKAELEAAYEFEKEKQENRFRELMERVKPLSGFSDQEKLQMVMGAVYGLNIPQSTADKLRRDAEALRAVFPKGFELGQRVAEELASKPESDESPYAVAQRLSKGDYDALHQFNAIDNMMKGWESTWKFIETKKAKEAAAEEKREQREKEKREKAEKERETKLNNALNRALQFANQVRQHIDAEYSSYIRRLQEEVTQHNLGMIQIPGVEPGRRRLAVEQHPLYMTIDKFESSYPSVKGYVRRLRLLDEAIDEAEETKDPKKILDLLKKYRVTEEEEGSKGTHGAELPPPPPPSEKPGVKTKASPPPPPPPVSESVPKAAPPPPPPQTQPQPTPPPSPPSATIPEKIAPTIRQLHKYARGKVLFVKKVKLPNGDIQYQYKAVLPQDVERFKRENPDAEMVVIPEEEKK